MWHIVVGLAVLSTVFSLVLGGLYKLSGKRSLCKRGQFADENNEAASGERVTEIRKPSIEWITLFIFHRNESLMIFILLFFIQGNTIVYYSDEGVDLSSTHVNN